MFKRARTTRALAMLLLTMTIVTPILIGINANYSNNLGTLTPSTSQPRTGNAPPALLTSKWNYSKSNPIECSPAIADIDNDGKIEVLVASRYALEAVNGTTGEWVHTYFSGETSMTYPTSPTLADVNGDGKLEVLMVVGGYLYCYNGTNGDELWYTGYGSLSDSPAIGDLNKDGKLEVVVGDSNGYVYSFNGTDGNKLWQYPAEGYLISSPTLADINGDGKLEVLVHRENSTGYDNLDCINSTANGSGYTNSLWSFGMGQKYDTSESSPAVADIDNDGHLEIVVGSIDGTTYCASSTGALKWSYKTGGNIHSSATIADIDGDGKLEILIGSDDHNLYCLNSTGKPKWSYTTGDIIFSSPAVADIDGDRMLEVLVGSHDHYLYCLNRTGGLEWRYETGFFILSSPAVADIDGDGKLEAVSGSNDGTAYCLSVTSAPIVLGAYPWPSLGYREDIRHTGCITDSDHDGLTNNYEITAGTNPNSPDTDGDTMSDYQEFLMSTNPLVDTVPPAPITNLGLSNPTDASVALTWTATGDNWMSGNANGYIMKYSSAGPITEGNWVNATTYTQSWTPATSGSAESRVVSGLTPHTHYWFAIKAFDNGPNYGGISNSPEMWTLITGWQSNPPINLIPGSGNNATMPSGTFKQYGFTMVTNNAANVVVTSASSNPPGTGSPPAGEAPFLYLDITGTQMNGTTGAAIYLYYNRSLVQSLGLDELGMRIHRWNATTSQWVAIPSTVTIVNSTLGVITAHLDHFSYFAVFGVSSGTSGSPTTLLLVAGAAVATIVVVAAIIVVKKRSAVIKTRKKKVVRKRKR